MHCLKYSSGMPLSFVVTTFLIASMHFKMGYLDDPFEFGEKQTEARSGELRVGSIMVMLLSATALRVGALSC